MYGNEERKRCVKFTFNYLKVENILKYISNRLLEKWQHKNIKIIQFYNITKDNLFV